MVSGKSKTPRSPRLDRGSLPPLSGGQRRARSYLEFLLVLELPPEAYLVGALQRLGHALDHEEQRRERDRGAERPHDRPPDALLRALAGVVGVQRIVDADPHQ